MAQEAAALAVAAGLVLVSPEVLAHKAHTLLVLKTQAAARALVFTMLALKARQTRVEQVQVRLTLSLAAVVAAAAVVLKALRQQQAVVAAQVAFTAAAVAAAVALQASRAQVGLVQTASQLL